MKISKNVIIIGLIVLNVGVVTFFLLNKPIRHHKGPKSQIINKLSLDEKQIVKFEKLIESHRKKTHLIRQKVQTAKKEVYKNILNDDGDKDSLLNELGKKLIAVDKHNIEHLMDVKSILNKEQMPVFKEFLDHIDRFFQPHPPRPPKRLK